MAQNQTEELQKNRRNRVERLKKIIVTVVLAAIFIPTIVSIILGIRLKSVSSRLRQVQTESETMRQQLAKLETEEESLTQELAMQEAITESGTSAVSESENSGQDIASSDGIKRVYLTFDDGPSSNTAAILDILAEYGVKATFFVVGDTSEEGKALYQRIVAEGHSIGVHSYSHKYSEIYASDEAFFTDFYLMSDYLYDVTGVRTKLCRLPGGSSNTVSSIDMAGVVNALNAQGVTCYDWNISGKDADGQALSAEEIADNVLTGVERFQTSMVLLHDGKDKSTTVDALRLILEDLTAREQLEIKPITEETPVILHITH
jgi:peptidoglycan/xylan/chitin deacetylase (PgdA/CDA1 family)